MPDWYLRRGTIKAATDDRLESASSSCERWGIGWAGLVVAGVIAEFVIAGIHPLYDSFLEQWGSAIADALVAIGIVGEVAFGMWDSCIQTELRKRSDEKLSSAIDRAAKLEKEAAEARARTAEIERVTAWRQISTEQHDQIVAGLRGKVSADLDILIEWERSDPEAYMYAWQIAVVLEHARDGAKIRGTPNSWLNWQGFGVYAHSDEAIDLVPILHVFAEAGVSISIQDRNSLKLISWGGRWPSIYIFVAAKPPYQVEQFALVEKSSNASDAPAARDLSI